MKTPRLLPVVIAATTALLLFKGIGLVTNGGYVLTGTQTAIAAGGGESGGGAAPGDTTVTSVDPTMDLPEAKTMADTTPTLADIAPVLPLAAEATAGEHGASAEAGNSEHGAATEAAAGAEAAPLEIPSPITPEGDGKLQAACPPTPAPASDRELTDGEAALMENCIPIPLNQYGDAIAMEMNSRGELAPVSSDEGSTAELLARLTERRDALDAREKELDMRMALVEAAEKRIEERTSALQALEERINTLVEEKKSDEKEQFAGIVAMYETMKPKEAATIFNALDTQMLTRVARAMNPRKMAPILARMEPMKAKALTAGLAREETEPSLDAQAVEDLANLPQIVGQ